MFLTVLNLGSNNNMREKFGDKDLTKISRENFQKKLGNIMEQLLLKQQ